MRQNAVLPPVQLVSPMPGGTALPVGSSVSTPLNSRLTVQPTGLLLTAGSTPVWSVPLEGVGGATPTQSADLTVVDAPPTVQVLDGNGFPFWYSNRTQGPCSPGTRIALGAQIAAADGVVLVIQARRQPGPARPVQSAGLEHRHGRKQRQHPWALRRLH
ncbi:hypothetical protein [Streptomyces sp. RTGN2]|uniref:hypothetical protein n=1 Tax=Streptomyces sp. RTGN2 TaxID=3016525 RepID=UPI0025545E76|nr:hypothetical protein [Streptomyces sp. RTGN2]